MFGQSCACLPFIARWDVVIDGDLEARIDALPRLVNLSIYQTSRTGARHLSETDGLDCDCFMSGGRGDVGQRGGYRQRAKVK